MPHDRRNSAPTHVESDLRRLVVHRPMVSQAVHNLKADQNKPGSKARSVSVVSFFQSQETDDDHKSNMQLPEEISRHPSLQSLLTDHNSLSSRAYRGFEFLMDSDTFFVKPTRENADFLFANHATKFEILNVRGLRIYVAFEKTDLDMNSQGCWCGVRQVKPFRAVVMNFVGHEVMRVEGESGFCGGGKIAHFFREDERLGRIEQDNDYGSTNYQIYNEKDQVVTLLRGPSTGCCGCSVAKLNAKLEFELLTKDGLFHLGSISKSVAPFSTVEVNPKSSSHSKYFGVHFVSVEIDVKVKALVLGALFLLHFEFINIHN